MKKYTVKKHVCEAFVLTTLVMASAYAVEPPTGVVGKNEWLFYNYELSEASHAATTNVSLDLIQRFNKMLASNGINLVVVMVPVKMRVYSEHLPEDIKINDYMAGNYDRMSKALQASNVNTVDLNTAFLSSPKRNSDTPLFFRLDTHWTPTGAMLAAETIKAGISSNSVLKAALDATPEEAFKLAIANRKRPSKGRDLVDVLPKNTLNFAPEMVAQVNVTRVQAPKEDLLGNRAPVGLTLVGSSYSMDWTGFSDALRYSLQRDILSVAVAADQGSWVGMESYLRDDAFQTKSPKIVVWEMPERDMRAPPDYKFRDARYITNNNEWLLRVSAWAQGSCKPSAVAARLMPVGLASSAGNMKGTRVATGPTNEGDFIEISFDKPVDRLDYLSTLASTAGSKSIVLEASGPGAATRRFTMSVAGDDVAHAVKAPLPSVGSGFTKVRVFPGKTNAFVFETPQICRQPEDILK
jgi:alginate O-acetyltransferase complex protein AlgJ